MGAMPNEPPPEYLLLRFYDTAVEPGKFYRYRVQLWLEDVNDPYRGAVVNVGGNPAAARTVSISWLDTAAAQRLKDKQAKDAKETPAGAMTPKHTYWRETEWSAPSPPVSLDREFNMYAGVVRSVKDVDRQRHGEPSGQVMAAQFDIVRAGDVACEYAIGRSAQVNFQDDAQMLNPVTLEVMPQKDYTFLTRHVVMDVRGGDPLPAWGKQAGVAADKSPVIPGEMLMLDERGQLVVKSEVDDFTDFDYYLYKPEAIAKPKPLNVPGGVNPGPGPIGPVGPGVERGGGVPFDFNAPGPRPGRGS